MEQMNKALLPTFAKYFAQEERQIHAITSVAILGPIDLVFHLSDTPRLIVAAKDQEGLCDILTTLEGGELSMKSKGQTLQGSIINVRAGGNISAVFNGSVGEVVLNGASIGGSARVGRPIVVLALPVAPNVELQGEWARRRSWISTKAR